MAHYRRYQPNVKPVNNYFYPMTLLLPEGNRVLTKRNSLITGKFGHYRHQKDESAQIYSVTWWLGLQGVIHFPQFDTNQSALPLRSGCPLESRIEISLHFAAVLN